MSITSLYPNFEYLQNQKYTNTTHKENYKHICFILQSKSQIIKTIKRRSKTEDIIKKLKLIDNFYDQDSLK